MAVSILEKPLSMSPRFGAIYTAEMAAAFFAYLNNCDTSKDDDFCHDVHSDIMMLKNANLLCEVDFLKQADQNCVRQYLATKKAYFEKYSPVRESLTGHWLLSLYKDSIEEFKECDLLVTDKALYTLLYANRNNELIGVFDFNQKNAGEIFHANFRKLDVIEADGVDMAIWELLCDAPIFWKVLACGRTLDKLTDNV